MTPSPTFARPFCPNSKTCLCRSCCWRKTAGVLKLGNISLDGTKIHADASKSHAVSYKRLLELESQLRTKWTSCLRWVSKPNKGDLPDGLVIRR